MTPAPPVTIELDTHMATTAIPFAAPVAQADFHDMPYAEWPAEYRARDAMERLARLTPKRDEYRNQHYGPFLRDPACAEGCDVCNIKCAMNAVMITAMEKQLADACGSSFVGRC
jgi:hypothetical protein